MSAAKIDRNVAAGIRRQRVRRLFQGMNVFVALILGLVIVLLLNYLAAWRYLRFDVSQKKYYNLSEKTKDLLETIKADLKIYVFFPDHSQDDDLNELYNDMRSILKEYKYTALRMDNLDLAIEYIDPNLDMDLAKWLRTKYEISEVNIVVFDAGGRTRIVRAGDLVQYDYLPLLSGRKRRKSKFLGEEVFSSTIQSITKSETPVVYFLAGHGERSVQDAHQYSGYSEIARYIQRDNIDVSSLLLARSGAIPEDCSALVIAGPDQRFSKPELTLINNYLDRNGRLLLLIDPAVSTGLEAVANRWDVELGRGNVVEPVQVEISDEITFQLSIADRDLTVLDYGLHQITGKLRNTSTTFCMPRPLFAAGVSATQTVTSADKPVVSVLASCTAKGWAEANLDEQPPMFDPAEDVAGPVPVALAVEKGSGDDIQLGLHPTRLVVIGDSEFVSNKSLLKGGNVDFFMSSLNWLLERDHMLGIGPKIPDQVVLTMNQNQLLGSFVVIVGVLPACAAFLGCLVWLVRRK